MASSDDDVLGALRDNQADTARDNLGSVSNVKPDDAVLGLQHGPTVGVPPVVAMRSPETVVGMANQTNRAAISSTSKPVRQWAANADPARVAATQDDFPSLARIGAAIGRMVPSASSIDAFGQQMRTRLGLPADLQSFDQVGQQDILGSIHQLHLDIDSAISPKPVTNVSEAITKATDPYGLAKVAYDAFAAATAPFGSLLHQAAIKPLAKLTGLPEQTIANDLWVLGPEGGLEGAAARASIEGDIAAGVKPPPTEPTEPGGRFKVDDNGHVLNADGAPASFDNARAAANWVVQTGQRLSEDQLFEPTVHPTEDGSYAVRQRGFVENPEEHTEAAVNEIQTARDQEDLKDLENEVGSSQTHARMPSIAADFVNSVDPEAKVWIDPQHLAEIYTNHPDEIDAFLKSIPNGLDDFNAAYIAGHEWEVSLGDYTAGVAGQPFADELRPGVRIREDGKTPKDLEAASESKPVDYEPQIQAASESEDWKEGLTPQEVQRVNDNNPAMRAALAASLKFNYLTPLFENAKAAGMNEATYQAYAKQIEAATQGAWKGMVAKVQKQIAREYTLSYKKSYAQNSTGARQDIMDLPHVRAAHMIRQSGNGPDLVKNNALVDNGKPIDFYHGTNYTSIDKWAVQGHHQVISFSYSPEFASRWAGTKGMSAYAEKYETVYITHLVAKNPADFRKPEDVEKAVSWYADESYKEYLQASDYGKKNIALQYNFKVGDSPTAIKEAMSHGRRRALADGDWGLWEKPRMWAKFGWDAAHVVEHTGRFSEMNIAVANGDQVHFKFLNSPNVKIKSSERKVYDAKLPDTYFSKNGISADEAAEMFGFQSGQEMIRALEGFEAGRGKQTFQGYIQRLIQEEAKRRTDDFFGNSMAPENILREAMDAVPHKPVEDFLNAELRALAEQAGLPFEEGQVKAHALELFENMYVGDAVKFKTFQRAIEKSFRNAEQAFLKKDVGKAFVERQKQLMNHYQLQESYKLSGLQASDQKLWKRLAKPTGKDFDQGWRDQIHGILQHIGVKVKRDPKELGEALAKHPLGEFLDSKFQMGLEPEFSHVRNVSPKDMFVREYRGISDMVRSWNGLGIAEGKAYSEGKALELAQIDREISENADKVGRQFKAGKMRVDSTSLLRAPRELGREVDAILTRPETYLYWVDGQQYGPLMKYVVRELQNGKYTKGDMVKEVGDKIRAFMKGAGKDFMKSMDRGVNIEELVYGDVPWLRTRGHLVRMMLNMGTESNFFKLTEGFGWDPQTVRDVAMKYATKTEWQYVQMVWDLHETMWPRANELARRVSGIGLKKVEARPIGTPHGVFRGGYYPITYDETVLGNMAGIEDPALRKADSVFGNEYRGATPANGYTKARTNFSAPLSLNFDTVMSGLDQEIHDIAYRDALIQANKILSRPTVRQAIGEVLGPEYVKQLRPWLEYIARQQVYSDKATGLVAGLIRRARMNFTNVQIMYNVSTLGLHSLTALSHAQGEAGLVDFTRAVADIWKSPQQHQYWINFVHERSGEVRNIMDNVDRDIREAMESTRASQGFIETWQYNGYALFGTMKRLEAMPTWLARYRQELEKSGDESNAIFLADKAVRDTQGAGTPVDLATVFRAGHGLMGEIGKLSTVFQTFLNTAYNRGWVIRHRLGRQKGAYQGPEWEGGRRDFGKNLNDTAAFFIVPALIYSLWQKVRGDTRPLAELLGNGALHATLGIVPLAEPALNAFEQLAHRLHLTKTPPPETHDLLSQVATEGMDTVANAYIAGAKRLHLPGEDGKVNHRWVQHGIDSVGYMTGWGVKPVANGAQYLWDYSTGREHPKNPIDFVQGMAFGPRSKASNAYKAF